MSDDEPKRRVPAALAHQPDWSRRHAEILDVEPVASLPPDARSAFLTAIATVSCEADLSFEHQRLLQAARPELERRERLWMSSGTTEDDLL